jgi:hypothetical protein
MNNGATDGYVLTTNASGVATWQANPGAVPGSDIITLTNDPEALQIKDGAANVFMTMDSQTGALQVIMEQPLAAGANQVSGSDFLITGGDVTGLDSLQLNTTTAAGYHMVSDPSGNASWAAKPTLQETYTGGANAHVTLNDTTKGLQLRDNATPITASDLLSVTNSTAATTYFRVSPTTTEVAALKFASGAGVGKVLVSDVDGNASWGTSAASGWQDDGSVVRLGTVGDAVVIGSTAVVGVEKLRVVDGPVLFDGVSGAVPTTGAGTRFMWSGAKAALRVGTVDGSQWDDANVGTWSVALGGNTTAKASYSMALGSGTLADIGADYSVASGRYSKTRLLGQHAQATTKFLTVGDAQTSTLMMSRQTTSNSSLELTLDGGIGASGNRLIIPEKTSCLFRIDILARRQDADDVTAAWDLSLCIDRNTGVASTNFCGAPFLQTIHRDDITWTVVPSADTSNGSLKILVTGAAATTINWVARVVMTEVST